MTARLTGKTQDEKAAQAAAMTNRELYEMTFATLTFYRTEDEYPYKEDHRQDYIVLRAELTKRLTRLGFLPALPVGE